MTNNSRKTYLAVAALIVVGTIAVMICKPKHTYHLQITPTIPTIRFGNPANGCVGKGICGASIDENTLITASNSIPVNFYKVSDSILVMSFSMTALKNSGQPDQVRYFSAPCYKFDFPYDISRDNLDIYPRVIYPSGAIISTFSSSKVVTANDTVTDTIGVSYSTPDTVNVVFGGMLPGTNQFNASLPGMGYVSDAPIPAANMPDRPKIPASIPVIFSLSAGDASWVEMSFNWDTLVYYQSAWAAKIGINDAAGNLQFDPSHTFYPFSSNIPLFAGTPPYYNSSFASLLLPPNAYIPAYNAATENNELYFDAQTRIVTISINYIVGN